jgi:GalNAc-alpha-(1->4)-GalNAc-alpha-(1->3)-diNAcBac-PP-undecaprenol alpha-1,4-N-acetyl-D-galactosaminyltransferase
LIESKGYNLLIQTFAAIKEDHPNLRLTIYGEGPQRASLEEDIKAYKLTKAVSLPGITKDVETALFKGDLFIFPSYFEGFPNGLCEAMAMGLPVIASDCSGSVDIIHDGRDGRLFPVGDASQLQKIIQELIQDSLQRQKLSQGAKQITNRYSETSILEKWDDIFNEIIRR